jgi:hypothetical protein
MERDGQHINIKGILIPVDWDDKGNVIKAAFLTANEEEYIVEENEKGKKLLGFMQQVMEIKGVVREEAGRKVITVETYQQTK